MLANDYLRFLRMLDDAGLQEEYVFLMKAQDIGALEPAEKWMLTMVADNYYDRRYGYGGY